MQPDYPRSKESLVRHINAVGHLHLHRHSAGDVTTSHWRLVMNRRSRICGTEACQMFRLKGKT